MQNLEETKRKRFELIHFIYAKAQGDPNKAFAITDVAGQLNLDPEETHRIIEYLAEERLVTYSWSSAAGTWVSITHQGVTQVEKAMSEPDKSTQYFPPVFNVIHAQTIIGSQIQQGTQASTQTGTFDQFSLEDMITAIQKTKIELAKADLGDDDRAEAEAEIKTLEAQAKSPRPKPAILRQAWATIKWISEKAMIPLLVEIAKTQLEKLGG